MPRILIIDRSPDVAKLLYLLLNDMAEMSVATCGLKGVALAASLQPALILLDTDLPDMDGLAVCKALKCDPMLESIPVLFLTDDCNTQTESAALEAGAVDYLTKPLHAPIVRARIGTRLTLCRQNLKLQEVANVDSLTGLYNRCYFDAALKVEFARAKRHGGQLSVAIIDIDNFKIYNARLGHQQGDVCLRLVAQALERSMRRPGEILARYGGEQFALVTPGVGLVDALAMGEWIRQRICELAIPHPQSVSGGNVTVSIGLASWKNDDVDDTVLVSIANAALYTAKRSGRNRCETLER
ncbi:diguanylate cyclase domain-containing protein [Duganella guangzhouensis]|uniref:diguanylate cyclase domain-containing protein n=1 Tax=Duganella guangzhouensis TaxID=2666084 RepID=UPI003530569B